MATPWSIQTGGTDMVPKGPVSPYGYNYFDEQFRKKQQALQDQQFAQGLGLQRDTLRVNQENQAGRLNLDRDLGMGQLDLGRAQLAAQQQQQARELSSRNAHFNSVFGVLNDALRGFNVNGGFATAGGQSGQGPAITVAPVYGAQQLNQQANAFRARASALAQEQNRNAAESFGGRGYGPTSPVLAALQQQNLNAASSRAADQERQLRFDAAGVNAQQILAGQKAQNEAFSQRQDEDIRRRQPYFGLLSSVLGSLGGLV